MVVPVIEITTARFVRQCLDQMRQFVPSFNTHILGPLHDNKVLHVNRTIIPASHTEIKICDNKYTYKCISSSTQERPFIQTRPFVRCSLVCESAVEVEPGDKCCKVSWFRTVAHWRICTVMFVLFTDCVNNRVVPKVDKRHE